jgi:hypothetical protein
MESIGRLRDSVITVESKEQNDDTRIDAPAAFSHASFGSLFASFNNAGRERSQESTNPEEFADRSQIRPHGNYEP